MQKKLKIGGQAVIEGVMMRSPNNIAIAVRNPKGKIVLKSQKLNLISKKFRKWFFVRGIINLIEMLVYGAKALNYSADVAVGDEGNEEKSNWLVLTFVFIASFGIALLIFKFLPLLVAQAINPTSNILFNLIDGFVKLVVFVAYVYLISLIKDVRRVFAYHGAEHKAVNCYEDDRKITLKNVKKYPTLHPRCGTSFLTIVIVVSILVYVLIPKTVPFIGKLLYRILLLPVIAGISYEVLKLSARYHNNFFFSIFDKPGLWIQKITTKEPDDKQIMTAIASLKRVLSLEKRTVS